MIQAKQIFKTYGNLEVLKGVDIEIERGSLVSIVGRSGSGKSTLLHILGTLDLPSSGQVILDGQDTAQLSAKQLASFRNQHIGFIFQFHHLLQEFSALENAMFPLLIAGQSQKEAAAKAKELLQYLGLGDRLEHKPSELSGGEQQRVAIARAMVNKPAILLADEPTGNLDQQTATDIHQLFLKLKADFGQTCVVVTHHTEMAALSDINYTMKDGCLL